MNACIGVLEKNLINPLENEILMMNAGSAAPGGGSSTAGISINIDEMRREVGDNSAMINQSEL